MILSKFFLLKYETVAFQNNHILSTQPEADYLWRIVLMLGALPAILTFYWRMKMPETGRYTALIEGNAKQAAADMTRVLEIEIQAEADKIAEFKASNEYSLWSREFFSRHGRHLIGMEYGILEIITRRTSDILKLIEYIYNIGYYD